VWNPQLSWSSPPEANGEREGWIADLPTLDMLRQGCPRLRSIPNLQLTCTNLHQVCAFGATVRGGARRHPTFHMPSRTVALIRLGQVLSVCVCVCV